MSRSQVSARPPTGRKVLLMIVGFFAVIFAVNGLMMKLAIQTPPGTEVDSAYSASLAYENEIAAAHDQDARGWKVDAHIQRRTGSGAELRVEVRDSGGVPVSAEISGVGLSVPPIGEPIRPWNWPQPATESIWKRGCDHAGAMDLVLEGVAGGQRLFSLKNRILLN